MDTQTTDDRRLEKLTRAFSSDELKTRNVYNGTHALLIKIEL